METIQLKNTEQTLALGLDVEQGKFYAETFIKAVYKAGGLLRIYDTDCAYQCYEYLTSAFTQDKDNYDDGYPKDPDFNMTLKLNGTDFEYKLSEACSKHIEKNSSSIFSIEKAYENEADFTVKAYKIKGQTIGPKTCEAKNFANIESVATARMHDSLYALVNSRNTGEIKLLCKLTAKDKADKQALAALEIYGDYKVIKPWFWVAELQNKYDSLHLGATWTIKRGSNEYGNYIEFISPKWTALL